MVKKRREKKREREREREEREKQTDRRERVRGRDSSARGCQESKTRRSSFFVFFSGFCF